jgi:hypothetical protein
VSSADHATLKTYTDAVKAADSTHPRLIMLSASDPTSSVGAGTTPLYDCADVLGDDYYAIGDTQLIWTPLATDAAGVASSTTAHSVQGAMTLQAQSWTEYYPPARTSPWPSGAPWPNAVQMRNNRDTVLSVLSARLLLWYSYFDLTTSDDPGQHWREIAWAANGVGSQPALPTLVAETLFFAYSAQSGWPSGWSQVEGHISPSITTVNGDLVGVLTGGTDSNTLLLGPPVLLKDSNWYIARLQASQASSAVVGIVFNYVDALNFLRVESISNTTIRLVSYVGGVQTVLGSGSYALGNSTRTILKVLDTGNSYVITIWPELGSAMEPASLFTVSSGSRPAIAVQAGLHAQLGSSSDSAVFHHFASFGLISEQATGFMTFACVHR